MKLRDLGAFSNNLLNKKVEQKFGYKFNTKSLTAEKAQKMLTKVEENIKSYKKNNGNLLTEKSPHFSNLMLMRDSLKNYLSEKAKSKAQQKFMGMVYAAKKGEKPASKEVAKAAKGMSKKAAHDYAATKRKGLPQKVEKESVGEEKVNEKWGEKNAVDPKKKGMFKGRTQASLKKELSKLKKSGPHKKGSAAYTKQNELEFALRSKHNWRKVGENKITMKKADLLKLKRAAALSESGKAVPAKYLSSLKEAVARMQARRSLVEGEVEQAQAILAAKDLVDRLQGMLEDVGQMMNEDLPPLSDSVRDQIGGNEASQFNSEATAALNSLLDTLRQTREQIDGATRQLAGEQDNSMAMPSASPAPDAGVDTDISDVSDLDTGDEFAGADAAVGGEAPLGREKR